MIAFHHTAHFRAVTSIQQMSRTLGLAPSHRQQLCRRDRKYHRRHPGTFDHTDTLGLWKASILRLRRGPACDTYPQNTQS
jgi:hypothetical protein